MEQHNGTTDVEMVSSNSSLPATVTAGASRPADAHPAPLITLHPFIISLSLLVLSAGSVSALHLFIWLCFSHPDAANLIIPMVLAPLFTYLVNRYKYVRKGNETIDERPPGIEKR